MIGAARQGRRGIRDVLARYRSLLIAAYLANDLRWQVRHALGRVDTSLGATHANLPVEDSVHYIETVIDDYRRYGGLQPGTGRAVEIGPGDNAGVGLLLRRLGYRHVDLVDRFASRRDPAHQAAIYRELSRRHALDDLRGGEEWREDRLRGITWHIGEPAEAYFRQARQRGEQYEAIVSRAALQYLYDPLGGLTDMVHCLVPGGIAAHKIDLRDHGLLTPHEHELSWLEIPGPVYRRMVRHSGGVNRMLLHRYRALLEELSDVVPIRYRLLVTRLVAVGPIEPHLPLEEIAPDLLTRATAEVRQRQPHFAREFRDVDPADLAVAGIFLAIERRFEG
jgi:SAM-dependent methyltransferase